LPLGVLKRTLTPTFAIRGQQEMNKERLVEELWWDIRKLGYWPDNDRILNLIKKAYDLGYEDGAADYREGVVDELP